jgi:hypothetical protein
VDGNWKSGITLELTWNVCVFECTKDTAGSNKEFRAGNV